jgi:hypothetical protein
MARTLVTALLCIALSAVIACGDDDDGAAISTGLPKSSKLSSLDDADAQKACEGVAKSFSSAISPSEVERVSCTLTAISLSVDASGDEPSGDVAGCKELTAMCVKGDEISDDPVVIDIGPDGDSCEDASVDSDIAGCDATVAEYERCISSFVAAYKKKLAAISCNGLADLEQLQEDLNEELVPSDLPGCDAFITKCPDVDLGGGGDVEEDTFDDED